MLAISCLDIVLLITSVVTMGRIGGRVGIGVRVGVLVKIFFLYALSKEVELIVGIVGLVTVVIMGVIYFLYALSKEVEVIVCA